MGSIGRGFLAGLTTMTLVVACGDSSQGTDTPPPTVLASDFDQSCTLNRDCVLVAEASVCAPCKCLNEAVNQVDEAAFIAANAEQVCSEPEAGISCGPCEELVPLCEQGTCAAASKPRALEAAAYPGTCTTANDCIAVFEGNPCAVCRCPNAAIPATQLEAYGEALASARCGTIDSECSADCAETEVDCVDAQCILVQ